MDFKTTLRKKLTDLNSKPVDGSVKEDEYFQQYLNEIGKKSPTGKSKSIPRFFWRLPKEDELLKQKLREETRSNFLQRRSRQLLDNNELKALWMLLDQHQTNPEEQLINYKDFQKVAQLAGPKVKPYFTAMIFAKLQQGDLQGRVSIMSIFNYVMRKVWLQQTRVGLSLYDASDDLLELRDEELSKEIQEQNWFSAPSALRVYGHYLNLDRDHNGMLSQSELAGYGSGTLTEPFLERVFQTCLTYGGEMDYKTYLDLVLALENRTEPQALAFLFQQMRAHGAEPVSFQDVKDELFDMVRPKDTEKITLEDLINCGQGDTFVSILIEFHGFWAYENREAVTVEPTQD
ncbi:serine/threonine-protein phosphatase 2a regulatory subunit b'' subunit gamma [Holotrichia oblita]|uniref:Serine/threonine-protein phosphatase 2a regulatory subunit b'' subunit gamma n=1 Tax=Holotrichia oblita TaxID=644536 RepID=A0ACB9TNV4_HOLOL|nr:serine/threonine-protein phosphatase 2a regulatory subunit b'' subunit gamma [Holotrichia oblita]